MARTPRRSRSDYEFPVFSPFREFKGKSMQWFQPRAFHRYHELTSGDDLYASLKWLGVFGSLAKVESGEGSYTLKRGGFLKPYVSVRDAVFETEFAVLNMNFFGGGKLVFADGREFTFTSTRFWIYEWDFSDESGAIVCSVRRRSLLKQCGDVVIAPGAKRDKHLMVTLAVAWYAIVLASEEAAATAAGAT